MLGAHQLGVYEKAMPPELTWMERMCAAEALGFDFVEISIDESDDRLARLDLDPRIKRELHSAVDKTGVQLTSMCLSAHRRFPFGSADPLIRAQAATIMKKALEFAKEFGIRVIQLAGYDVYYEEKNDKSAYYFEEGITEACHMAEQAQIMLAVETMDTEFMNDMSKAMGLISRIRSPWFTVYPDIGNLSAWRGDAAGELKKGQNRIVGVHLKDTIAVSESCTGVFRNVPFGSGCVDFKACFAQLEKQGYRGPYLVEMWYSGNCGWREEISRVQVFLRDQFEAAEAAK